MNAAILVSSLVLGGVYIPEIDESVERPGGPVFREPAIGFGLPSSAPGYRAGGSAYSPPRLPVAGPRPDASGLGSAAPRSGSIAPPPLPYGESGRPSRQSGLQESLIPFAPTDPSAASEAYPWGPPTAGPATEEQAPGPESPVGGSAGAYRLPRVPGSAAYARPRPARPAYRRSAPYASYATRQATTPRGNVLPGSPYRAQTRAEKPFTDYTRPRAVSPYMQLDRRDSSFNVIDNYSQYVRPVLERQRQRQQLGLQLRGLQSSVRNLGRQTESLRGVAIPQYYMNYGGYYPGLGGR